MQFKSIGRSRSGLTYFPTHRHIAWELIYNCDGSGTMTVNGEQIPFSEGTVVLCPPGSAHEKQSVLGFTDYYLQFSDFHLPQQVYVLEDDCERRLFHLIRILHHIYYENKLPGVCESLFDALAGLLRHALSDSGQDKHVQQLRSLIIRNFTDPDFHLQQAQKSIPIDPDHLRRQFKQATGQTPHAYLTQLRLEYARQLLSQGAAVSETAYRAGFYDPLYFSRLFRRHTGLPPSRWAQEQLSAQQ